jgi:hypothetical protein
VKIKKAIKAKPFIFSSAMAAVLAVAVCMYIFWPKTGVGGMQLSGEELPDAAQKAGLLQRSISREEYAFFETLVKREKINISEEELAAQTKKTITEVNARFALGSQLGVCQPFSYENFMSNLEAENASRASMKQTGEVFYGPEKFEAIGYYGYITSNLDLDIARAFTDDETRFDKLQKQHGEKIEAYFEENIELYQQLEGVSYELSINGAAPEVVDADWSILRILYMTDDPLGKFLIEGIEGDTFEYTDEEGFKSAKILEVGKTVPVFEDSIVPISQNYVTIVYYPKLLELAIEMSRLEFPG